MFDPNKPYNCDPSFPAGYTPGDSDLAWEALDYFTACADGYRARMLSCEPRTSEFDENFVLWKRAEHDVARMRVFLMPFAEN